MNRKLTGIISLAAACLLGSAGYLAAQVGPEIKYEERTGFEYDPSVLPPDLGPSPFAPPLPPTGDEEKEAVTKGSAVPLPPGAVDALSIYPDAPQAPMAKTLANIDGFGPVFNAEDVKVLGRFQRQVDPGRKLGWEIGKDVNGRGIKADQAGRLVGLMLKDNELDGVLSLSGAKKIVEVDSAGNKFSGLKLADLPLLSSLSVTGADLGGLAKGSLGALPELGSITIKDSGLDGIEGGVWAELPKLRVLRLGDNRLGHVGTRYFAGLERLSELSLENNRIRDIQKGALGSLTGLITLRLDGNRLGSIGNGVFKAQSALETLRLDNNAFERIGAGAFSGLKSLKNLNLAHNYINFIDPAALTGLDRLNEVDLKGNCLSLSQMAKIKAAVPSRVYLRFDGQKNVYFGLRAHILSKSDTFTVPAADAAIGGVVSRGRVLGRDPGGAVYTPPEAAGQNGSLKFLRPGFYRLELHNPELSARPEVVSVTGHFLVAENLPDLQTATVLLGRKDLAANLVNALISQGYVEASAANPKRMTAIKALLEFFRKEEEKPPTP